MTLSARLVLAAIAMSSLALSACVDPPPSGKPTDLSPDEKISSFGARSEWWGWHAKGMKSRALGHHEKALFCFLKAEKAWPAVLPAGEEGMLPPGALQGVQAPPHRKVPLETLIAIAELYMFLRHPQWALAALDVVDREVENGMNYTRSLRVETLAKFPKTKAAVWPR